MRKSNIKKPVLVDCDGVIADFVGATLKHAHAKGFDNKFEEMVKPTQEYPYWEACDLEKIVREPGFCESIDVLPGAQKFIENVRSMDIEVVFVTSPMKNSPYWHWERQEWLAKHFAAPRQNLIFAVEKKYVNGLALLDDHVGNILHWQEYNNTRGMLIKQPWNEDILKDCDDAKGSTEDDVNYLWHSKKEMFVARSNDWPQILNFVKVMDFAVNGLQNCS